MVNIHGDILDISKRIEERNISLVIDVSGSMYKNFEVIKEASMLLLNSFVKNRENATFNVISFADHSSTFSNSMIPYSNENLALATTWINSLNCESNTNTLSALVTAFNDDNTDAVIIFTDGLPNQKASVFHKCVAEISQGRPIHCIYVSNGYQDNAILQFWEKLVTTTDGSLHVLAKSSQTKSKQIYPYELVYDNLSETDSLSGFSSSSSYYDEDSSSDEDRKYEKFHKDYENKYLGKVVLAKRKTNGFYYKGTIVNMLSADLFVVLFQPSNDVKFELQQKCYKDELIFYEDAKKEKIYTGDNVLVNLSAKKRKYIPGCIKKKEYLFDDDDTHGYDKVLKVELFDGGSKTIPLHSAVRIPPKLYKDIVRNIEEKQQDEKKSTRHNNETERDRMSKRERRRLRYKRKDVDLEDSNNLKRDMEKEIERRKLKLKYDMDREEHDSDLDSTKDYLRDRIDQQLKESQELLSSLNIREKDDDYVSKNELRNSLANVYEDMAYDRYEQLKHLRKSLDDLYTPSTIPDVLHDQFDSGLIGKSFRQRTKSADVRFKEPTPPPAAWKTNGKRVERTPQRRYRSASVGSNVVERSKKHWAGRPISKETSPKKHTGRYKSTKSPPTAEEYQTNDGIPFPIKTDKRFNGYHSDNWVAGQRHVPGHKHHDIIAHRVVNFNKNKPPVDSNRYKRAIEERNRMNVMQTNREVYEAREKNARGQHSREVYEAREKYAREQQKRQYQRRDEQMRKQQEQRKDDGYTKVKITIEKGAAALQTKQQKHEEQRMYEKQREAKNQEKKMKRVVALRERNKTYEKKDFPSDYENEIKSKKQYAHEKNKITRQIDDHESKLARLKKIRKHTDARLRHLKNSNDGHRDMTDYVKDVKRGHVRCEILP